MRCAKLTFLTIALCILAIIAGAWWRAENPNCLWRRMEQERKATTGDPPPETQEEERAVRALLDSYDGFVRRFPRHPKASAARVVLTRLLEKLDPNSPRILQVRAPLASFAGDTRAITETKEITVRLAMLYEGECEEATIQDTARKFGYTKQRYYQLLHLFAAQGALALQNQKTGPKTNYRRTDEVVRQVIRHRFLDPEASPEVITQKMQQSAHVIGTRSVERVLADSVSPTGLRPAKKTLSVRP